MPEMTILMKKGADASKAKRWVQWLPEGAAVGFMVPDIGMTLETEEICELLAELVEKYHGTEEANKAFTSAREQLETTDYAAEWAKIQMDIYKYRKWGGPVPEAVFFPDTTNPKEWLGLRVDEVGDPHVIKVRPGVFDDIIPTPQQGHNAVRGDYSWIALPPKQTVERRREMKAQIQAKMRGMREMRIQVGE
jgi:hypothetical protein